MKKFEKFMDEFNKYFGIPAVILIVLSVISVKIDENIFSLIVDWVITIVFILGLVINIIALCNKFIKEKFMIGMLISSLVLIILSYIFAVLKLDKISNITFIIGVVFLEVYLLCIIVKSCLYNSKNIGKIIIDSLAFIVLGFATIYLSSYGFNDKDLFNSLITVFAAIIGGGITLVGVAWTIRKTELDKKQEEKQKVKPYLKNYLKNYVQDKNIKVDFLDINKNEKNKCQGFVLYLHNIGDSIVFITDLVVFDKYYPVTNVVLEKNGKIELRVNFYYEGEIQILKTINIIGHDILNNYYSFEMNSNNLCEEYEDTRIELPKEIEYNK